MSNDANIGMCRLALGVPSKLPARALDLAEDFITAPSSKHQAGQAVEREAGYILLGALCLSFPEEALVVNTYLKTAASYHSLGKPFLGPEVL